jgi:hypothetical protein
MKTVLLSALSYLCFILAAPLILALILWDFKHDPSPGRSFSLFSIFTGWFVGRVLMLVLIGVFIGAGVKLKELSKGASRRMP